MSVWKKLFSGGSHKGESIPTTMFKFKCPSCQATITGRDDLCGQSVQCPRCRKTIVVPPRPGGVDELLALAPDPRRTYLLHVLVTLPAQNALESVKAVLARQGDLDPVEFQFGDGTQPMRLDHRDYTEADIRWVESAFEIAHQADVKAKSGQFAEAIPLLKTALQMCPGQDLLLLTLGVCYAELKEIETAIKILQRAHQLYPANRRIHDNLEGVRKRAKQ